jgi:4-diphosphocytidyl-2-C-methyl-D-erythritol kinase
VSDAAGGWSDWPAPAKLNLFLRILGRRPDGYHHLQTVFQLLDWGDTVRLRLRSDGQVRRTEASGYTVPEQEDLAVRAAKMLLKVSKSYKGVDICVEKRIPVGGGFGGGSSNAATVLVALNALWDLGLSQEDLAAMGRDLGADVPVFVRGRSAWAEGIGDQLTPIELAPAAYLLVDTGVHVATAELFQTPELTRDAAPATIADFVSGSALGNAFEPVLRRRSRAVEAALQALSRLGPSALTGTGGGCFARFDTRSDAEAALGRLPSGLRGWVAQGVSVSPLHRALHPR